VGEWDVERAVEEPKQVIFTCGVWNALYFENSFGQLSMLSLYFNNVVGRF
jgi:hypothetical protein